MVCLFFLDKCVIRHSLQYCDDQDDGTPIIMLKGQDVMCLFLWQVDGSTFQAVQRCVDAEMQPRLHRVILIIDPIVINKTDLKSNYYFYFNLLRIIHISNIN